MTTKKIEDENEVVRDGGMVRVPMLLMDGKMQLPQPEAIDAILRDAKTIPPKAVALRTLPLSDAELNRAEVRYASYDAKLTDAWKNPPALDPTFDTSAKAPAKPATSLEDAYARRDNALESAWKGAA